MIHIGKLIKQKLDETGKTSLWLAEQLSICPYEMYEILNAVSIDTDTLLRISSLLKYNFFQDYSKLLK